MSRAVGPERLLVPVRGGGGAPARLFTLNETAAFLWEELGRPRTVAQLSAALESEFDVSAEQARQDARRLLDQLVAEGCADEVTDEPHGEGAG